MHPTIETKELFLLDPDNDPFAPGRTNKLRSRGQGCVLLFLGAFALAGVLILAEAARQWVHFWVLSTYYAETQGRVVDREMDSGEATTYYVTYRFVAGDEEYTVRESVNRSIYEVSSKRARRTCGTRLWTWRSRPWSPVSWGSCQSLLCLA